MNIKIFLELFDENPNLAIERWSSHQAQEQEVAKRHIAQGDQDALLALIDKANKDKSALIQAQKNIQKAQYNLKKVAKYAQ